MKPQARYALLPLVTLILLPLAAAQERAPARAEYDVLASIAGTYTYQGTEVGAPSRGRIAFELLPGGRFLRFEEQWTPSNGPTMTIAGIIGFDAEHNHYTWYRVFENGAYDQARGTFQDGTITFDMIESHTEVFGKAQWAGPGIRLRTKWMVTPARGLTRFVWERSVNRGSWELLAEADCKRSVK